MEPGQRVIFTAQGRGCCGAGCFVGLTVILAWFAQSVLLFLPFGLLAVAILGASLPAQKSLEQHVEAVATALEREGVEGGRKAVSMIVGRDPQKLDEAAICRAAIESLAENFSDGIVAPAVWMGLLGLPGGAAYKAVNTADSMIGHRSPRHEAFGWASARLDDLINLPASRLSGSLFVVAAFLSRARRQKRPLPQSVAMRATTALPMQAGWRRRLPARWVLRLPDRVLTADR